MTAPDTDTDTDRAPAADGSLPVSEVFHTLQGEGPAAGRRATFIRLGGCNLSCDWCDTPYTWDRARFDLSTELTTTPASDLVDQAPRSALVVLTGGEPLLQQGRPGWSLLLAGLAARGCTIHVETNGTLAPTAETLEFVDLAVVSPKLGNAGLHRGGQNPTLHPSWVAAAVAGKAHLKVVCADAADVGRARSIADAYEWPAWQTWAMPEGTDPATLAARWPAIATAALEHGINASTRLHVLAWGDERGR